MTKGAALPETWAPSRDDVFYGLDLGFSEREIAGFAEDMRLWAGANSNRAVARKADWGLTFKGWMRRAAGRRQEKYNKPHEKGYAELADEIRQELAADHNGARRNDDSEPDLFSTGAANNGSGRHY